MHGVPVAQSYPATNDTIDEPEPDQRDWEPDEEKADPKGRDDEDHAKGHPQQPKPERANLPAKMRFKPGPTNLASFDVVENHCDDRWPTGEKCADHRGRANDAGQQAERVEGVDDLCPGDQ